MNEVVLKGLTLTKNTHTEAGLVTHQLVRFSHPRSARRAMQSQTRKKLTELTL